MKTAIKTTTLLAALLLLAGCTAAAEDSAPKTEALGWGPGWRHEQMAKAWEKGEFPGPMMMMRTGGPGPGARGFGPPVNADGKIDTSQTPPWCPLSKAETK